MKADNKILLFLACAGMDLCFLYAATNFATSLIFQRTFPFAEAVASFLAAALLTLFLQGRGWRVLYILAIQSLAFVPAMLRIAEVFRSWNDSFMQQTWFTKTFNNPADAADYFLVILIIVWALVFWAGGAGLAGRPKDYATLCSRFDRGLQVFFSVFLLKLYYLTVQGVTVNDSMSGLLIIPFLIFSLLALGLVRTRGADHKEFMPGFQRLGVLLGFIVITLLAGTALLFFFLPLLTMAAETGNTLLAMISGPLLSLLFMITTWLFGTDFNFENHRPEEKPALQDQSGQSNLPGWLEFIGRILVYVFEIAVILVILAVLAGIVYAVVVWLFSRTEVEESKPSPRQLFLSFMRGLWGLITAFGHGLVRGIRGYQGAVGLYTALRIWGGQSGLPPSPDETPLEYGRRLKRRFPLLESQFEPIVNAFNRQVYGESVLGPDQLKPAQSAWRALSSPAHWPMRLKSWFIRPTP